MLRLHLRGHFPWESNVRKTAAIGCLAAYCVSTATFADETASPADAGEADSGLAEIVVTAQKREESLQQVPLAVSALDSRDLESRGLTGLAGLQDGAIPSVRVQPFSGSPTQFYVTMRGFGQANSQIGFESGVPIFIDDVYFGLQQGAGMELTELDRIEVLRGPQGTLFGKNAAGGALRLVSRKPSGEFDVRENVSYGNYGYWRTDTHVDLPKVAGVSTKFDLLFTDNNGWEKNPDPNSYNGGKNKEWGGKFSARWQPTDTLTVDYAGVHADSKNTSAFAQLLYTNDPYQVWPVQTTRPGSAFYPVNRPLNDERSTTHSLNVSWEASEHLTARSITGYSDLDSPVYNMPIMPANFPFAPPLDYLSDATLLYDIKHHQFSEELQLVGDEGKQLQWVAGLYYEKEGTHETDTTFFGTGFPGTVTNAFGIPVQLGTPTALAPLVQLGDPVPNQINADTRAVFGQMTWRPPVLDEKLAFTAGARYGVDRKNATRLSGNIDLTPFDTADNTVGSGTYFVCPCAPVSVKTAKTSPLAIIAYDWTPLLSTYLRFATGYRAPAFSFSSQTFRPNQADDVDSYELGLKSEWLDRRLRLNVAAFFMDWKKPQIQVQTTSYSVTEQFNGPNQTIEGLEFDLTAAPTDALSFSISYNYYKGQVKQATVSFGPGNVFLVPGTVLQLPENSGSALVNYDFLHTVYGVLRGNLEVNSTSQYFSNPLTAARPGYTLLNARLAFAEIPLGHDHGSFDLTIWGKNLTNKSYTNFGFTGAGTAPGSINIEGYPGDPRMYGVTASFRF